MKKIFQKLAISAIFALGASAFAQKVSIDCRFNVSENDGKNYLNWSVDKEKHADSFDAETGASKNQSTKALNAIRYDSNKKLVAPAGLRSLLLFAVASPDTAAKYGLKVKQSGKKLEMSWCRNGKATLVTTDEKGRLDLANGFKVAVVGKKDEEKNIVYLDEFLKDGAEDNKSLDSVDWSKVVYSDDKADPEADGFYDGKVSVSFKDNVLTVKGKLAKKARK